MFKNIKVSHILVRTCSSSSKKASLVPTLKTKTGVPIPVFGLGTWKSKPGKVAQAVKDAIDYGYRHIDGAYVYGNEKEVGEGVNTKIKEGVVKREDLFITSKLWCTFHRPEIVETALKTSLKNLELEYVNLYLVHFPFALKEGPNNFPMESPGKAAFADYDYVSTWKALEELPKKGLTKLIGISNFNKRQVERLLQNAAVIPAVHQIECHPYLTQEKLSDFCKSKEILVAAYSPLGSPDRPWAKPDEPVLLKEEKLISLAKKYNKSLAQVLIRYQVQRGHIVLAKSVTKSRIQENFNIWDFEISAEDIQTINSFNRNLRVVYHTDAASHKDYPFNDEY